MELTKEQEKVLESNVKDLVVSASAGSGKTFVVIEKLIGLICDKKIPVERLLVLTFTKAASNEMKARLYNAILQKPSSKFLIDQIDSLPLSDISTIDSFCEKIIKRNINKLDLDENFVILDEKTSFGLKKLAFSRTFQYFSANESEKFEEIYFAFKRNKSSFQDCIFALQEYLSSAENQEELLSEFENNIPHYNKIAQKSIYSKIMEQLLDARKNLSLIDMSLLNKNSGKIFSGLDEFAKLDCKDIFTLINKINNLPLPAFRGKIEEEVKEFLNKAKDSIKEAIAISENYLFLPADAKVKFEEGTLIKAITAFYKHYIKLYNGLKEKRDGLDFADIEYYAKLLLQDEDIKKGLQDKYDYIFIDEYQDTNRLQQSIIKPIGEGGHFVAVGDLKQGIYGFRNARMEIMQEDIENFANKADGDALFLTGNFRTDKNILEFVNSIFEKVMTSQSVGIDYKKTSMLKGLRHFEEGQMPAVAVDVVLKTIETDECEEKEELQQEIYSVKDDVLEEDEKFKNEILAIQNRIEQSLNSQIYDAKLGRYRKVTFSDITLLFRNRSALMHQTYKTLSKKGFPINADIKEVLLEDGEIGVIYSLLKLTLNVHDDIALASVMNSYFGGFSLEELASLRLDGDKIPFYQIIENCQAPKVEEFKEKIGLFAFELQIFGVIKALNRFFTKHDYFSYLQSLADKNEKSANINALFKLIRSSNIDNNVNAIISQLESAIENGGGGGGNAITMTTIHATKGLEYPIVLLCGAGESLTKAYAKNFIISEKFGFASYINDFENMIRTPSPAFLAGKMEKQDREFVDEIMIFYVAMTRAQNHLFIIGSGKEKDYSFEKVKRQNSYLKMIFFALGEKLTSQLFSQEKVKKGKWELNVFDEFEEMQNNISFAEKSSLKFAKELADYNSFEYKNKKICKIGLKNSVTGATKLNEEKDIILHKTEENENSQFGQEAIDRGNAYHEALKLLDFDKINSLEELTKQLEEIKDKMTEGYYQFLNKDLLLRNIILIKDICADCVLYKEKEFIMKASLSEIGYDEIDAVKFEKGENESVIVQGIVDLFALGKEIVLVDYKFSSLNSTDLKERYSRQIELYAMALEKAFGKKIEKRYLISLKKAEVIQL